VFCCAEECCLLLPAATPTKTNAHRHAAKYIASTKHWPQTQPAEGGIVDKDIGPWVLLGCLSGAAKQNKQVESAVGVSTGFGVFFCHAAADPHRMQRHG